MIFFDLFNISGSLESISCIVVPQTSLLHTINDLSANKSGASKRLVVVSYLLKPLVKDLERDFLPLEQYYLLVKLRQTSSTVLILIFFWPHLK